MPSARIEAPTNSSWFSLFRFGSTIDGAATKRVKRDVQFNFEFFFLLENVFLRMFFYVIFDMKHGKAIYS